VADDEHPKCGCQNCLDRAMDALDQLADLNRQRRRAIELEAFAHEAGLIIVNIAVSYSLVPEKEELLPLAEEYFRLFPPTTPATF